MTDLSAAPLPPVPNTPAAEAAAPLPEEPPDAPPRQRALPFGLSKRQAIITGSIAAGALIIGAGLGLLALQPAMGAQSAALAHTTSELRTVKADAQDTQDRLDTAQSELYDLRSKAAAVTAQAAQLDQRAKDLTAAEAAVKSRENAVKKAEDRIVASQVTDGVYEVGKDAAAGVYRTAGPSGAGCYYAWKTSTASDADIIDNNIVNGPATVTLRNGQVFESNGCQVWNKVG